MKTDRKGGSRAATNREPRCKRSAEIAAYLPLVKAIAGRIVRRVTANVDRDELIQVGMIGLYDAITRFQQRTGSSFQSYAARRIEGAMLDSLRSDDTLSRSARSSVREIAAAVKRLEHLLGRAPRAKEVANELGWSLEKFHACMVEAGAAGKRSEDEALEDPTDPPYYGSLRDDEKLTTGEFKDPLRALQQKQRHAILSAAFDTLEAVERYVMESIYDEHRTLRTIGEDLGVSEARVSQIHAEVVAKLKMRLADC